MTAEQYMAESGIAKLHLYAVIASKEAAQRDRDLAKREVERLRDILVRASRLAEEERAGLTQQVLQEGLKP